VATETNATLHERAIHELKEFTILAVYLYHHWRGDPDEYLRCCTPRASTLLRRASPPSMQRSWPNSCCSASQ
jgi:hypothetical protein